MIETSTLSNLGAAGYVVAVIAYLVAAVTFLLVWRHRIAGVGLTPALCVTALWAALIVWSDVSHELSQYQLAMAEFARDFAWLLTISSVLKGATGRYARLARFGGILTALVLLIILTIREYLPYSDSFYLVTGDFRFLASALLGLVGLIGIEQIYRNARPGQRPSLKYLCYGMGLLFAYNVIMYTGAMVQGEVSVVFWQARGYIAAMAVPLILTAVSRGSSWQRGLFMSRQVVFFSATLFAAAVYLFVVGLLGLYIRVFSDDWGEVMRLVFLSAAGMIFVILTFSEFLRYRLKAFVYRHFYTSKYDYRNEWLRLIGTLTSDDPLPLKKKCIKALAQIVGSDTGFLWLPDADNESYDCSIGWNIAPTRKSIATDADLIHFLKHKAWVIDLESIGGNSRKPLPIDAEIVQEIVGRTGILIPLVNNDRLLGFVVLPEIANVEGLDHEDFDLLRTAGRQIGSYLIQETLAARASENRQFEAFNRLTAYLIHDFTNLVAQQSLVVENAAKYRNNPKFVDDAFDTIRQSVVRMRKILELLKREGTGTSRQVFEIAKVIEEVVAECQDRMPRPEFSSDGATGKILADPSHLRMSVYHAIRNAQDATPDDGQVVVSLGESKQHWRVSIRDTGRGMDADFVQDRLFVPFDTTKGTHGMGIGAYQIRQCTREMGGKINVESEPGKGTSFHIFVPQYERRGPN